MAASDQPAPVATITMQIEQVYPDATGKVVSGTKVFFKTTKGVDGSVFVPSTQFSPDVVRDRVRAAALQLNDLQGSQV